jgi:hypothetical protein
MASKHSHARPLRRRSKRLPTDNGAAYRTAAACI